MFPNQIVGWAIDDRVTARIVVAAIEMPVARRGDATGRTLHSDEGRSFAPRRRTDLSPGTP